MKKRRERIERWRAERKKKEIEAIRKDLKATIRKFTHFHEINHHACSPEPLETNKLIFQRSRDQCTIFTALSRSNLPT